MFPCGNGRSAKSTCASAAKGGGALSREGASGPFRREFPALSPCPLMAGVPGGRESGGLDWSRRMLTEGLIALPIGNMGLGAYQAIL